MLQEKYTFKQSKKSSLIIATNYRDGLKKKNDPLHFLCAMNLKNFMGKLWAHGNGIGGKVIKKINMNQQEALAFWVDYVGGFMDADCPLVNEIFTEIDRSLNNEPVKKQHNNPLLK